MKRCQSKDNVLGGGDSRVTVTAMFSDVKENFLNDRKSEKL